MTVFSWRFEQKKDIDNRTAHMKTQRMSILIAVQAHRCCLLFFSFGVEWLLCGVWVGAEAADGCLLIWLAISHNGKAKRHPRSGETTPSHFVKLGPKAKYAKKITTRLFVNRNWAQFKREHHNGQWLWLTVNLMFLHRTGQDIYFHRALTEKNECLRALEIMFELLRCRFYNRNKNASLLNGIERFSGSKRILLRNEYFFSLK